VNDLTSELQEHMEREKELVQQYEDLYYFLSEHVAKSKVGVYFSIGHDIMVCSI